MPRALFRLIRSESATAPMKPLLLSIFRAYASAIYAHFRGEADEEEAERAHLGLYHEADVSLLLLMS